MATLTKKNPTGISRLEAVRNRNSLANRVMDIKNEISQVFAQIILNNKVGYQDIRRLAELSVPAIGIAVSLVDSDKFIEAVNKWCNDNNM